jgi:CarboxypepD_reg-like domain
MQVRYFFVGLLCLTAGLVNAQDVLKGTVTESGSNTRLNNVFIRDKLNKQLTLTDKQGNFTIKTETGHTLIFESPGYMSDTLYVVDLLPKKIGMVTKTIALREVNINASRAEFDPHKEYPEVYTKSKVYVMSPSSWFSKEGKDARRLKHYFQHEAEERHVDAVFSKAYVGSIVPLKGQELEDFMVLYRPTYAFLRDNGGASLVAYINDSYKKYKALPPDKRSLPKLTSQ